MTVAKLFMNGRSQAVRLPRQFRFDGDEVRIRREGCSVILEPIDNEWSDSFWSSFGSWDEELPRFEPQGSFRDPFG